MEWGGWHIQIKRNGMFQFVFQKQSICLICLICLIYFLFFLFFYLIKNLKNFFKILDSYIIFVFFNFILYVNIYYNECKIVKLFFKINKKYL